jgi:hypothetical protein
MSKATPKTVTANMTDLRLKLTDVFDAACANEMPWEKVKQIANVAGKVIGTAKVQVEYALARKEKPEIPFLK